MSQPHTKTILPTLRSMLSEVVAANPFYQRKFAGFDPASIQSFDDFAQWPTTCKSDFVADQNANPPYGTNLTFPLERYTRLHQTSGTTTGQPLRWLDTAETWNRWLDYWKLYFSEGFGFTKQDRLLFPFSFGPFIGFWSAFDAASRLGYMVLPCGGMPTTTRLRYLLDHRATILFATPTYALHMAEVAANEKLNIRDSAIRAIIVAGEPGGGIPSTRKLIEEAWGARVFDHYGMTEVGPVAIEMHDDPGHLHIHGEAFHAEVLQLESDEAASDNEEGELVLTNLGRVGSPAIRYRTGDIVQLSQPRAATVRERSLSGPLPDGRGSLSGPLPDGRGSFDRWLRLDGGIRGRTDDMIHIRGNNVYASAIESVIRRFPEVAEFQIVLDTENPLADLRIEIEPKPLGVETTLCTAITEAIRDSLLFRANVVALAAGQLPRYELKARRVVKRSMRT